MVSTGVLALVTALSLAPEPGWQWPLRPPPEILRPFDPPAHPWEAGHRGTDLAARAGQPVYAAGPGRVGFAHDLAGRGVVTVIHGRLRTTYLPVRPSVRAGQVVAAGARIGVVEDVLGHCGQSACLHWGLRQGVAYFDPLTLLGRGPVRLLPWWRPRSYGDGPRPPTGRVVTPAEPSSLGRPLPPSTAKRPDSFSQAPTSARQADPAERPRRSALLAVASAGGGAPVSSVTFLTDAFATLAAAIFRAQRPWVRHRRRTSTQSYPQNVIRPPRSATIRQIQPRR